MSDLYHETFPAGTAEPDNGLEPTRDASSGQQYETAEPADRDYGEYTETGAEVQARIASQDGLPAQEESRQATWGDNPDYYDETDLGTEYDGDVDAFLAEEDELPTPQESRAHTWGDNPDYYDEADLASEYDGDLSALTTEEDDPAARHAPASPETDGTHAESAIAPEDKADSYVQGANVDNLDQNAASTANDQSDQAGTHLAAAGPDLASEVQDTQAADDLAPAAGRPDDPSAEALDSSAAGPAEQAERVLVGTSERITELETENAQLGKSITDLQARLERLEQANQEQPVAPILDRERDVDKIPGATTEREHRRRLPSDTRLALGGTIAGIALSSVAEHMSTGSAHMMEYIGDALSVGIGAVAVWRENRKKNDRRPED